MCTAATDSHVQDRFPEVYSGTDDRRAVSDYIVKALQPTGRAIRSHRPCRHREGPLRSDMADVAAYYGGAAKAGK